MKWFEFNPIDTLFFRGSKPMVMGSDHTASLIFPPPSFTIEGALRTAYLVQNNIPFKDYNNDGFSDDKAIKEIGRSGETPPFSVIGPFFKKDEEIFVPVPYHWFAEKEEETNDDKKDLIKCRKGKSKEKGKKLTTVVKGEILENKFEEYLNIPDRQIFFAKGKKLEPLGGNFVNIKDLNLGNSEVEIFSPKYFFAEEQRTGIAIDKSRIVRDGYIYSFTHARLKKGVSLIFGTTTDLEIEDKGELTLGAEQRFGLYKTIELNLPEIEGKFYMSLSLIKANEKARASMLATGRIAYYGGWDLKRGFHKDLSAYFPAGSIFKNNIDANLISIN